MGYLKFTFISYNISNALGSLKALEGTGSISVNHKQLIDKILWKLECGGKATTTPNTVGSIKPTTPPNLGTPQNSANGKGIYLVGIPQFRPINAKNKKKLKEFQLTVSLVLSKFDDHGILTFVTLEPHSIMVSYNWDNQPIVVKLVKKLQQAGYNVWLDLDEMTGSSVEAMAAAVEGAKVPTLVVLKRTLKVLKAACFLSHNLFCCFVTSCFRLCWFVCHGDTKSLLIVDLRVNMLFSAAKLSFQF